MLKGKSTVLVATSVDLAGTSASNDTVRRMHDDKLALSNKWVLPAKSEMKKEINPLYQLEQTQGREWIYFSLRLPGVYKYDHIVVAALGRLRMNSVKKSRNFFSFIKWMKFFSSPKFELKYGMKTEEERRKSCLM